MCFRYVILLPKLEPAINGFLHIKMCLYENLPVYFIQNFDVLFV